MLAAGCAAAPVPGPATPSTTHADGWFTGLDSQPTVAVTTQDRAYVTTAGSARFPPQIYAVDLATGSLVEQRTATGQPYDAAIVGGELWIAGDRHPDQPSGAGVNVHDPETLVVVDHVSVGGPAFAIEEVKGEVWVGTGEGIAVIDPGTRDVVRTIGTARPVYHLERLPDGTGVLGVDDAATLTTYDLAGSVVATHPVEADGGIAVAVTSDRVWLRVPVGSDSRVLVTAPDLSSPLDDVSDAAMDSAGGGIVALPSGTVVVVDDRSDRVWCLSNAAPTSVSDPDAAGALAATPDGQVVVTTATGVALRTLCTGR